MVYDTDRVSQSLKQSELMQTNRVNGFSISFCCNTLGFEIRKCSNA